jgi:hypothetical protein
MYEVIETLTGFWLRTSSNPGRRPITNHHCEVISEVTLHQLFDFWGHVVDLNSNLQPNRYNKNVVTCFDN